MKIIHLSDLHFGTETPEIVTELIRAMTKAKPDLIIISGDFTQRATTTEFKNAQDFINKLPAPVFCVPGNHDIPPYKLWDRFIHPYKRYKQYIDDNLCPEFQNDHIVIAGLNSARRIVPHWNWANGAISQAQLQHLQSIYNKHDPLNTKRRVCVFHHPIHKALNQNMKTVVFGAQQALNALNDMKVDLVLTGHVHHASVTTIGDIDHRTLYLSASTALSSRLRKQQNGFNIIQLNDDKIDIEIYTHTNGIFKVFERYSQQSV